VNPGWIAGSVRARLLLEHRAGPDVARELGRSPSLGRALEVLAGTPYAPPVVAGPSLEDVQRAVAASVAFSCRVLAAWLPRDAAVGIRAMASWFEIANIEDRIAYLVGAELRSPFELGVLSSVWEAAAAAGSLDELRRVLGRSVWGDPGTDEPQEMQLWLRFSWARRVAREAPGTGTWAAGALAILLAAELFVAGRFIDPPVARRLGLGESWQEATTIASLRERATPRGRSRASTAVMWRRAWWQRVTRRRVVTRRRLDDPGGPRRRGAPGARRDTGERCPGRGRALRRLLRWRLSMPLLTSPCWRIDRIAIVAPRSCGRDALSVRAQRTVELVGNLPPPEGEEAEALRRISRQRAPAEGAEPTLLSQRPDVAALERAGGQGLLAGEVEPATPRTPCGRPRLVHRLARWT
jgi:hypothetical protein